MGWFKKEDNEIWADTLKSDPTNPYTMNIEDEGTFVTIVHRTLSNEVDDGSTDNSSGIPEQQ